MVWVLLLKLTVCEDVLVAKNYTICVLLSKLHFSATTCDTFEVGQALLDGNDTSSSEMSPAPELGHSDCIYSVCSFSIFYDWNIHIMRTWFNHIEFLKIESILTLVLTALPVTSLLITQFVLLYHNRSYFDEKHTTASNTYSVLGTESNCVWLPQSDWHSFICVQYILTCHNGINSGGVSTVYYVFAWW